jgi:hypothetical protein
VVRLAGFSFVPWPALGKRIESKLSNFSQQADNSGIAASVTRRIEAARTAEKTLLPLHNQTKAGGEHGRALAGGHALLGVFDMAIEVIRACNAPTGRKVSALVRGHGRTEGHRPGRTANTSSRTSGIGGRSWIRSRMPGCRTASCRSAYEINAEPEA